MSCVRRERSSPRTTSKAAGELSATASNCWYAGRVRCQGRRAPHLRRRTRWSTPDAQQPPAKLVLGLDRGGVLEVTRIPRVDGAPLHGLGPPAMARRNARQRSRVGCMGPAVLGPPSFRRSHAGVRRLEGSGRTRLSIADTGTQDWATRLLSRGHASSRASRVRDDDGSPRSPACS